MYSVHIECSSHLSGGSGLLTLYSVGLRVNLRHVLGGQVAVVMGVWCAQGSVYTHSLTLYSMQVKLHSTIGCVIWQRDNTYISAKTFLYLLIDQSFFSEANLF